MLQRVHGGPSMQLKLSRSQKKGLFKTKYVLSAHLQLTSEEQALLKRHKLGDLVLFNAAEEWGAPHIFLVTAGGYIQKGSDFDCGTVNELAILENSLQENCRQLAGQLKNLDGAFDGTARTINFDD